MRLPSTSPHPRSSPSPSGSATTPSLHSRLVAADEFSLSILGSDTAAMEGLLKYWVDLQASLQEAISNGTATTETLELASKVTSRTKYIADNVVNLYEQVQTWHASFSNMRTLFQELSLEDRPTTKAPVKYDPTESFPLPAYVKPAYEWLLSNLHNPYPTKAVKRSISEETNTSVTYIENWFTDVRRKIGWTTLSKERFYNKRSLIIEAATRAFRPASATPQANTIAALPTTLEDFDGHFQQIEDNAKNLYVDKLYESKLALKVVESSVINPTSTPSTPLPEVISHASSRKRRSTRSPETDDTDPRYHKRRRYEIAEKTSSVTPYSMPSPSLSIEEISSTAAEASPRPIRPIPLATSMTSQGKRKRQDFEDLTDSPSPSVAYEPSIPISHSAKRKRISSDSDDLPPSPLPMPLLPTDNTSSQPRTRKRRLSDATAERPSKRPHNVPSAPRLQAVSDPLPVTKAIGLDADFEQWWANMAVTGESITLDYSELDAAEPISFDDPSVPLDISWDTGFALPPTPQKPQEETWMATLQNGVAEIDNIFADFLDPKVFEEQYNADLFPQDINQNLLVFDDINAQPMSTNFAPVNFQGASQDLSFALNPLDFAASPQNFGVAPDFHLPTPAELLQSFQAPVVAPAQYDLDALSTTEDKATKAAKIQRLREELMRLEAEEV